MLVRHGKRWWKKKGRHAAARRRNGMARLSKRECPCAMLPERRRSLSHNASKRFVPRAEVIR